MICKLRKITVHIIIDKLTYEIIIPLNSVIFPEKGVLNEKISVPQYIEAKPLKINPIPMVNITVANGGWPIICLTTTESRKNPNTAIITTVRAKPMM